MKKQLTSFMLILALVITMVPMSGTMAFAANSASPAVIDVSDDSGTNLPAGVSYSGDVFTIGAGASGSAITITGTTVQNVIVITDSAIVTLILSGASITAPGGSLYSPIDLQGNADVTLQLAGGTTNTISAANTSVRAGIHAASTGGISATLSVSGTGTLNVTGGAGPVLAGAGIGGYNNETGGTININGGTVNTTGGSITGQRGGAGIGGGNGGAGGMITINGGTVNAASEYYGAGIGGGSIGGAGGIITISGGIVNADGGYGGAGIGGGYSGGAGGDITISGGIVTAICGLGNGTGIGGSAGGASGDITINGGIVTATGANYGAGIGSGNGYFGIGGNITINDGEVNATGGSNGGAGIGSGASSVDCSITVNDGTVITTGGDGGAGLGGGVDAAGGNIIINNGTVTATGGDGGGAGIGGGFGGAGGTITISGIAVVMAASLDLLAGDKPAIDASAGTGSVINTQLDNAISAGSDTYLKCGGNVLKLPANYMNFAFNAAAAAPINAWSDPACTSIIAGIVTTPGGIANIPLNATIDAAPTPVTTSSAYTLTVNLDEGNGPTVSGSYASGTVISIDAGTKSGYTFSSWTSSNGGTFTNAASASTTFTMPGNATTITANWTENSSGGGSGGGSGSHTDPGTNITIDHEDYSIGDESKDGSNTTVTVDQNKFEGGIAKASERSSVTIPVSVNDSVTVQLVVKNIEDMAKKDMTLTVQTGKISYNLNTTAIDTASITKSLGTSDSGRIPFNVCIANSNAVVNGTEMVISPMEFTITATYNGNTVYVDTFSSFLDRTIEITAEQAKKITTAVVVEPNRSLRHVPTKVTVIDGKYYAVINSLTNSTYTVIWNPVKFSDVAAHWAKDTINDMGSRMVISGVGQGNFEPDRDITRAEFAAIVIRALGLAPSDGESSFADVSTVDWYSGYVNTASKQEIITGYDAAIFGPNDKITREQAMTMIARAMKITGLNSEMKDSEISALIANYVDGTEASEYAKTSVAACLKPGVITGRTSDMIAPKDSITRAEVAVIVQRLLQKSNLI